MVIGQRLKELRSEKGVSQKAIADHLGITQRAYSYYEQGLRLPPCDVLVLLCDYFNVPADYLLGRIDGY